ncbi:MAG: GTP cyclohydrolase II [Lapillicoccus sp.]
MTPPLPLATIRTVVTVPLRTADGWSATGRVITFDGLVDGREHLALELGSDDVSTWRPGSSRPPLVRLHSECLTGDVFGSERCDCGPQLRESLRRLDAVGGYLLYLRQEGRGIGLYEKLDAYLLQDAGLDTYDANLALGFGADERDYASAAQMLTALGLSRVSLLSNNPDKAEQLTRLGVAVTGMLATGAYVSPANAHYLETKAARGGHMLDLGARSTRSA